MCARIFEVRPPSSSLLQRPKHHAYETNNRMQWCMIYISQRLTMRGLAGAHPQLAEKPSSARPPHHSLACLTCSWRGSAWPGPAASSSRPAGSGSFFFRMQSELDSESELTEKKRESNKLRKYGDSRPPFASLPSAMLGIRQCIHAKSYAHGSP